MSAPVSALDETPRHLVTRELLWAEVERLRARVAAPSSNDVLETFWREVVKAWDSENMADNEGLMVTIGRPVIDAARGQFETPADSRPCGTCAGRGYLVQGCSPLKTKGDGQ